jgi:hypothetical protein
MPGKLLLSTAYLPPSEYFSLIKSADEIWIEQHENYLKQTYRNRCKILSSNGITILSVPVSKGHNLKALIRDITIDYSKRWQQVHLRAVTSAYSRSPFFQFFFEHFEKIITANHKFLIDLNNELLKYCLDILKIKKFITYTHTFEPADGQSYDFRYRISPKIGSEYRERSHIQVFSNGTFKQGLSILDLIFNTGPDASHYL